MMGFIRLVGLWCGLALGAGLPALAQTGGSPTIMLPQLEDAPAVADLSDPAALSDFGARRAEGAAKLPAAPRRRMPLVAPHGQDPVLRLSGEAAAVDLTLFVPPSVLARDFQLVLRTSINALPERSFITVIVNGQALSPIRADAFDDFVSVTLDSAALQSGENTVRVETNLYHRIYCGPEASFALWVEVDTANSGILLPQDYTPEMTDLPGLLAAQSALPQGLGLRAGPDVEAQALGRLAAHLTAILGPQGRGVGAVSPYAPAPAVPDILRVTVLPGDVAAADLVMGGDGAAVLRLRLPAADADLAAILPHGAAALPQVTALIPGQVTSLIDLGRTDTADRGHYIRHDVPFSLPSDWLVLGPQIGRFTLTYGFANQLAKGALLLVKVNGTTVRLLPLDVVGGDAQPPLVIGFKASLLRPGVNALTLEAIIPGNPPDLPCVGTDGPVLFIGGASTLLVPPTPRMQFAGIEQALFGASGVSVSLGTGAGAPAAGGAALLPLAFGGADALVNDNAQNRLHLRLLTLADADMIRPMDFELPRGLLTGLISPAPQVTEGGAGAVPGAVPLIDLDWITGLVGRIGPALGRVMRPGDPALAQWAAGRRGDMVLIQPDATQPHDLWLLMGPNVTEAQATTALSAARTTPQGPSGRLSVLDESGQWHSWRPAATAPVLLEPLTLRNARFIIGTYASWSPVLFMASLLGLTALSIIIAIAFVLTTRGRRKQ